MANPRTILAIAAHSSDFVWRCSGALAVNAMNGGRSVVLAMSYGERGESGELWKLPGQTVENVKKIRHEEAAKAAAAVGAEFETFDLGDYPLIVDRGVIDRLAEYIRNLKPDAMITHTQFDPYNPDHGATYEAAYTARQLCAGAGVASAFETIKPPAFYIFEPHQPEICHFVPTVFCDITKAWDKKKEAMACLASQKYLQEYYTSRGSQRGHHARRNTGFEEVKFAEAFQRLLPGVVDTL